MSVPNRKRIIFMLIVIISGMLNLAHSQEVGLFRLRRWGGSLRSRYELESRFTTVAAGERTYNSTIVLRNKGFIISPEVLSFQWIGDLALFLEQFDSPVLRRDSRGKFLGHNLTATLFQSRPNSMVFFWNKNANMISQKKWGRTDYNINHIQTIINLRGLKLPSRLQLGWRDLKEQWDRAGFRADRNQLKRSVKYDGKLNTDQSNFEVNYDFFTIRDRIRTTWSYGRHNAGIRYRRIFGEDNARIYDSKFNLYFRSGVSNHKNARLNQSLELKHSPSLSSQYHHNLSFTRSLGGTILQNTISASLLHRLFNSLNSSFGGGGTFSTLPDGKIYTGSIGGSFNYTKKIPLSGRILISYTKGISINDLQTKATERAVLNERHAFLGGLPIRMNERNIIISSIVVFDERGEFIFEQGEDKDYFIRFIGEYVEIYRNPFGRIKDDEAILISYNFRSLPAMCYSTFSDIFSAGLNFGWLLLNYNINRHDQNLIRGDHAKSSSLHDIFSKVAQLHITRRNDKIGTSFLVEHKIYQTNYLALTAFEIRHSIFFKIFDTLSFSNKLTYSNLKHEHENLNIEAYAIRSELRWLPSYSFTLQGYGKYNMRKENIQADESNFEYGVRLQRLWRLYRLLATYDKRSWEFGFKNIKEHRFMIELERVF